MQQYKQAFELSSDLVLFLDKDLSILWTNNAFINFKKEHHIKELFEFIDSDVLKNAIASSAIINREDVLTFDFSFKYLHFHTKFSCLESGTFVLVCHSTQHKETIHKLTYTDQLTQVGNRALSRKVLNDFYKKSKLNPKLKMIFLGINFRNFDRVDYFYGYKVGDRILKDFAQALQNITTNNKVFRSSGSQLLLMHTYENDDFDINGFVEQVIDIFIKPIEIDNNNQMQIFTNIGIVVLPKDAKNTTDAFTCVSLANDKAEKLYEKVSVVFYQESFGHESAEDFAIEKKLEEAIQNNRLELFYQPKIDLGKKQIYGFEALLRWKDPELGFISPLDFIPIAENTGQIVPIGLWVLRQVCLQNNAWQKQGFNFKVSLNVSIRQLQLSNFIQLFQEVLEETGADTSYIELEITENILSERLEEIMDLFEQIKKLGFSISLDDFGTSYSSLSYLKDLPIDILKIDKSFIKDSYDNIKDSAITKTIVTLAKELDLKVIAEGVETKEQVCLLENLSCDFVQGFYYYRPLNNEKLEDLLKKSLTVE